MTTITDYDEPRPTQTGYRSIEELRARKTARALTAIDADEAELGEFELPADELSEEQLTVTVVPIQQHEFQCQRCFLVLDRRQRALPGRNLCRDCA